MINIAIFVGIWSTVAVVFSPLISRAFFRPSGRRYSSLHADAAPCDEAAPRATSRQAAAVAGGASKLPAPDAG